MADPSIQQQIKDNFQLAQALQLVGTLQTFVIGNKALSKFYFIQGAIAQKNMQNAIDQVVKDDAKNKYSCY